MSSRFPCVLVIRFPTLFGLTQRPSGTCLAKSAPRFWAHLVLRIKGVLKGKFFPERHRFLSIGVQGKRAVRLDESANTWSTKVRGSFEKCVLETLDLS